MLNVVLWHWSLVPFYACYCHIRCVWEKLWSWSILLSFWPECCTFILLVNFTWSKFYLLSRKKIKIIGIFTSQVGLRSICLPLCVLFLSRPRAGLQEEGLVIIWQSKLVEFAAVPFGAWHVFFSWAGESTEFFCFHHDLEVVEADAGGRHWWSFSFLVEAHMICHGGWLASWLLLFQNPTRVTPT